MKYIVWAVVALALIGYLSSSDHISYTPNIPSIPQPFSFDEDLQEAMILIREHPESIDLIKSYYTIEGIEFPCNSHLYGCAIPPNTIYLQYPRSISGLAATLVHEAAHLTLDIHSECEANKRMLAFMLFHKDTYPSNEVSQWQLLTYNQCKDFQ